MKKKITRWLLPTLFAVLLSLIWVTPVLAVELPDELSINGVWVYRNCKEAGDQLYLVDYTIDYSVTGEPDESATANYWCRLRDGDDDLAVTYPFAYNNDGYGRGVVALYFDAGDAPEWEGLFTMQLLGSPFQEWDGALPEDEMSSLDFDIWQDYEIGVTRVVVSGRILNLAETLETAWGEDMVTLTDGGEYILTNYAAAYFVNVVPYLYDIAPNIFAEGEGIWSGVLEPEIPPDTSGTDYADSLVADIIGTPLDVTPLADAFGVSRGSLTALLYYGVVALFLILVARGLGSTKPIMLLSIPAVVVGAFIGVPLIVTILIGLLAIGFIAYSIFYKPSNA